MRTYSGFIAAMVLLLLPLVAVAGEPSVPSKAVYLQYCSACHGPAGKGDGVVSGFMTPKPTNLTQLAKQAGGQFPAMKTMQAIDGTTPVRAHGESAMPVWGTIFKDDANASTPRRVAVQGKLLLLVDYVRSIQEP